MGYEAVQALLEEEHQSIIDIVAAWPSVQGTHDIGTRQSDPTRFIQLHLEMDDHLPLYPAYQVAEQVKQALIKNSRF
ncbi:hypothetical protein BBW68_04070 [Candidatus Erwinia dacicola]|uniref:Cation efflux family protein n=1 Tax=Candidatus Erwinia dacicola TaxID=252393 RepID=A0A1E7Z4Y5_9GAMM|nr:hypothetical protein BBW68_04070 [Candidatus Erwinia dacicola]RAP70181.1 cation efflux family protein [Candidatus Erwinia dacicola]